MSIITNTDVLTKSHKSSHFAPAFLFLSGERRRALEILYAICRLLDDAVDAKIDNPGQFLDAWKAVFIDKNAEAVKIYNLEPIAKEFLAIAEKFELPLFAMVDLIEKGVQIDLERNRFQTVMDLEGYCYGVAGTVGLSCLPIFGVSYQNARDFAVRLGIAIQWVNVIRDVGVDIEMNRIYLPLDHLEQFGYTEADLKAKKKTDSFFELMAYETSVARSYFKRAQELMPSQHKESLLPARIMGQIYTRLLDKIERNKFDVFDKKIRLNIFEKGFATLKSIKE